MKCSVCGKKIPLSQWQNESKLEQYMESAGVYSLKKVMGGGNYCPQCAEILKDLFFYGGENALAAKEYFDELVKQNTIHANIDTQQLELYINKKIKENGLLVDKAGIEAQTTDLMLRKKCELDGKFGTAWVYLKSEHEQKVCAQRTNDALVLVENFDPQITHGNTIDECQEIYNTIEASSVETLFMVSVIPIKDIVSYQSTGTLEHTTVVSGGGGGGGEPNLHGAVVGGLLFGTAGAIIGSQTGIKIDPVKSQIIEWDYRKTSLMLKNSEGKAELRELPYYYAEIFAQLIPEKEYNFLQADNVREKSNVSEPNQSVSVVEELKQLKELLDLGIITQDEFDAKKRQLLKL